MMKKLTGLLITGSAMLAILAAAPALAGWKRIEAVPTEAGKGAFVVKPQSEWNRWSRRLAKRGETWTKDGFQLNQIDFFGQVSDGESIYKERSKKYQPLPKYQSTMLPTDLADLFQANFSIVNDVTKFDVRLLEPSTLGGIDGIRMIYEYALPNDALTRVGEVRMVVYQEQLYVVNFTAPELHYFGASIDEVHAIMDSVVLN